MQRKRIIFPSAAGNAENPGANLNAPLLQPLLAQTTGDAQGSGEPPGKMPAASCILKTSIFYLGRIVGVPGARTVFQIGVVSGTGIFVVDYCGNGSAAGEAIQDTGQKFRLVFFLPGSGPGILPRCPPAEKCLKLVKIYFQTRRNAVKRHPDGRAVGLTKNGQF